ncbi:MAG: hypothetical protein V1698_02995 [bacterium]
MLTLKAASDIIGTSKLKNKNKMDKNMKNINTIQDLAGVMFDRFGALENGFSTLEKKIEDVEKKLESKIEDSEKRIVGRLEEKIEVEIEGLARMTQNSFMEMESRMNQKFEDLESKVATKVEMNQKFEDLESKLIEKIELEVGNLAVITKNGFDNVGQQIAENKEAIEDLGRRTTKLEKVVFAVK